MISRIRMRIFIPTLAFIVLFPILAGVIFSCASDWYMDRLARQSLTAMMDTIRGMADQIYADSGEYSRDEEKVLSKELMSQVRGYMRRDRPQSQLIAMNSRLKLTYPRSDEYQPDTQSMYQVCKDLVMEGELLGDGTAVREISLGEARYLVSSYETESEGNVRGRYLFGYVAIPDTGALLSYAGALLLLIACALSVISLAAAWLLAGSISKPLLALCNHAEEVGRGKFEPMEERCSIREIESLRHSFNRMTEELEQMNRQQNAFFQNASHELRTPLMSIGGYAQGIQCGVFADHEAAAGVILEETMRMKELVDGILTMSKMDGGRLQINCDKVELTGFVREELTSLGGMAVAGRIELQMAEGDGPVTAEADTGLLSRAFRNVISNCVRYAAGRVDVRVEVRNEIREGKSGEEREGSGEKTAGRWAVITVQDDGPGFSEQDLPHIFERFYKGEEGNFGIGLSIVRGAMEYMGGDVTARNVEPPGHGAVFSLYLPVAGEEEKR